MFHKLLCLDDQLLVTTFYLIHLCLDLAGLLVDILMVTMLESMVLLIFPFGCRYFQLVYHLVNTSS